MTKRIALVALLILFAPIASFSEAPATPWPWESANSSGDPQDAVCRSSSYFRCDRVECCSVHCLDCVGGPDDGFIDLHVCDGICYPRTN